MREGGAELELMRAIPPLLFSSLLMAGQLANAGTPTCPDTGPPPAPVCIASPHGLVYADTEEEADNAARAQAAAVAGFETYFGQAPSGVVILSTSFDPLDARQFARTSGLGYSRVWLPAAAQQRMTSRAMRQAGLDRTRIRHALNRLAEQQQNTLRHEIGHSMYADAFWPEADDTSGEHYGSPAPDWLDEAAAILMESVEAQGAHAGSFIATVQASPGSIPPLTEFLEMEHPVRAPAIARQLAQGPRSDSGIQMMVSGDTDASGLITFYGQSLLVGVFLIETSGDPHILAAISTAVAAGNPFPEWLAENGPTHGLPVGLESLQEAWETWSRALPDQSTDAN